MKKTDRTIQPHQLYFIATPIGNLEDISHRAISLLSSVDRIYAEDTRTSSVLLKRYQISARLFSYHAHNQEKRTHEIISFLAMGGTAALISDAGMPLINDPGYPLVQSLVAHRIGFTVVPGACAPVCALVHSGLPAHQFLYKGYVPVSAKRLKDALSRSLTESVTSIWLLPKKSLRRVVATLCSLDPHHPICIARELTKKHETVYRCTIGELAVMQEQIDERGEFVLLIGPAPARSEHAISAETHALARAIACDIGASKTARYMAKYLGGDRSGWYKMLQANLVVK